MCLICVEFGMSRLTIAEARRNLKEMSASLDEKHVRDLEKLLTEKEAERIEEMSEEDFLEEFGEILADGSD